MVDGVNLEHGMNARFLAEEETKGEIEYAIILHLSLEEMIVRSMALLHQNPNDVMKIPVRLMVPGESGLHGMNAQYLVEVEIKEELVYVTTPHPNLEEMTVR